MSTLQDGSLVRLVQVTDVTSENETSRKLTDLERSHESSEVELNDIKRRLDGVEKALLAFESELDGKVEQDSYDPYVQESDLDNFVSKDDVDLDDVPTMSDVDYKIEDALKAKETSVTLELARRLVSACPDLADGIVDLYQEERADVEAGKKKIDDTDPLQRISFKSNGELLVELEDAISE